MRRVAGQPRVSTRLWLLPFLPVIVCAGGVILAENAIHLPKELRAAPDQRLAALVAARAGASWQEVEQRGVDGVVLRGWLFRPPQQTRRAAILLHGVGDSRRGMLGFAEMLLKQNDAVLLPDSRGHGVSGGNLLTYGVRERENVHRWARWLTNTLHVNRLYGLGESMGAAILLQSLPGEPAFAGVVAESSFATFHQVAYDRLAGATVLPRPLVHAAMTPFLEAGLWYVKVRYGVDLWEASPEASLRTNHVPVLLTHGQADDNIPIGHSRQLRRANPGHTALWEVARAGHCAASTTAPQEFAQRVLSWFQQN